MAKKKDLAEDVKEFQNQMQEIREQMSALKEMNYVELQQQKTKVGMKKKEETDSMAFGDCTFKITTANEIMLNALSKYAMMLDYVTQSQGEDSLNVEGVINNILYNGMSRMMKDLVKRHGFESSEEFIDCMRACQDGEEVMNEIKHHECTEYQRLHDDILAHIPVEDKQTKFDFAK